MSVTVKDRLPNFRQSVVGVLDDAINTGARDVHIAAKVKAPYRKGGLRSNSDFRRVKLLHWRVSFWLEYARFQEFGGDGKRVVRRYTTAGTGAHYLQRSGDDIGKQLNNTLRIHAARARA